MGEVYKGLTIRFGGDTTQLKKELKSLDTSLSAARKALRDTQKALNFDPHGLKVLESYTSQLSDKIEVSTSRVKVLKNQIANLSDKSIEELANGTVKFSQQAAIAKNRYSEVVYKLAAIKDKMNEAAKSGQTQKAIMDKNRQTLQDVLQLAVKNGDVTQQEYATYKKLVQEHGKLLAVKEKAEDTRDASQLAVEYQKTTSEIKNMTVKLASLKAEASSSFGKYQSKARESELKTEALTASIEQAEKQAQAFKSKIDFGSATKENYTRYVDALADALKAADTKTEGLRADLEKLQKATNNQGASKSIQQANQELIEARTKVEDLEKEFADVKIKAIEFANSTEKSANEIRQTEQDAKDLEVRLKAAYEDAEIKQLIVQEKKLNTELAESENSAQKLKSQLETVGTKVGKKFSAGQLRAIGTTLSTTLSSYAMQGFNKIIDSAETIDSSYRNMRKTVNGTEEQFESLKQAALDFSQTHVTSADQILEIQALGGQLGIGAEDLAGFAEAISNIDIATNVEAEDASIIVGQLINILDDLDASNVDKFSNALVRLGNNNAALESDILEVSSRIGSAASIYKMSTPQILAWSTAIASTGQKSESAGTAISKTMSMIESATVKGGDKLKAFAKVAGMSSDEFKKKWQTDASGAMQAFVEGLHKVDENGGSVDATLINLGITGVRQKQALNGLSQTVDTLNSSLGMSKDAWDNGTDAADEANKKAEGFSGQISILKNNVQVLAETFGESLAPILKVVNSTVEGLVDVFKSAPDAVKAVLVVLTGAVVALGPVITMVSAFKSALNNLGINFNKTARQAKKYAAQQLELATKQTAATASTKSLDNAMDVASVSMRNYGTAASTASKHVVALSTVQSTTAAKVKTTATTMSGSAVVVRNYGAAARKTSSQVTSAASKTVAATSKAGKGLSTLKNVATSATGGVVGLATAAVAAAVAIGTHFYEEYKKNEAATTGLINAQENAKSAFGDTEKSVKSFKSSIKDTRDELAEMAGEFEDTWSEFYSKQATVEEVSNKILKYAKNTKEAKKHQSELKIAVKEYNELTGESLNANDLTSKGLSNLRKELKKTKKEWIKNASAQIYSQQIAEEMQKRQDALKNYQAAQEEFAKQQKELQEYLDLGLPADQKVREVAAAEKELKSASEQLNSLDTSISKLNAGWKALEEGKETAKTTYLELISNNESFINALNESGIRISELKKKLVEAGVSKGEFSTTDWDGFESALSKINVSMNQFVQYTPEQIQGIFNAYNSGLSSAVFSSEPFFNAVKDGTIDVKDFIGKFINCGAVIQNFANLTPEQVETVVNAWRNGKGNIKEVLKSLPKDIRKSLNISDEDVESIKKQNTKKTSNIFKSLTNDRSNMASTKKAASSNIKDAFMLSDNDKSEIKSNLGNIGTADYYNGKGNARGKSWTTGFAGGLLDKVAISQVVTNAATVANKADKGAKSKKGADEHSPSHKAYAIGQYWTQGLALGISENENEVYKAAQRAASLTSKVEIPKSKILSASNAALQEVAYNANVSVNSDISSIAGAVGSGMASLNALSDAKRVTINLNYSADADANQMVADIARGLRRMNLAGA